MKPQISIFRKIYNLFKYYTLEDLRRIYFPRRCSKKEFEDWLHNNQ
jgi:hypothetical protein